jgi:hypothetical protein
MTTRDSDDDPLDRRAKAILEIVRECWKALSDLDIPDRVVALDKLDQLLGSKP